MKWIIALVLATILIAGCTQPVPNQTKNLTETGENASKVLQEIESNFHTQFRVEFARNAQNVIKVGIRNTGNEGSIYLEKIKAYVDGETKAITNIVGTKSNMTIEPGEVATFDVNGVNDPCNKLIKIVLSSGLEDGRLVSC